MYERMLNKEIVPSSDDLLNYCGETVSYGNRYDWNVKYIQKSKHTCIFLLKNTFTEYFNLSNSAIDKIYTN